MMRPFSSILTVCALCLLLLPACTPDRAKSPEAPAVTPTAPPPPATGSDEPTKDGATDPGLMVGNWTSADDPDSQLRITADRYVEIYAGENLGDAAYTYHAICPNDCSPAGDFPCISVTGGETVCYAVIGLSESVLQLSMVGGRGNTLEYLRK